MQDVYNISYNVFMFFIGKIADKYGGNRNILKPIIIDVLINKKSIFNEDLNTFIDDDFISLDACKKVIMFMLVSKSYVMNYYDFVHDINSEYTEYIINELESLSKNDVIELFYKPTQLTDDILEDFFAYIVRPYVFESKAKELIFENGKVGTLLKLNPFEVLDIWDYIPEEEFLESEKHIQTFYNLYEKAVFDAMLDESDTCEEYDEIEEYDEFAEFVTCEEFAEIEEYAEFDTNEDYDDADKYVYNLLINNIREHFEDDSTKIFIFLSYIMSNVYEFLVVQKKNNLKDFEDFFDLIDYFENKDIYTLKEEFLFNADFALRTIDLFVKINKALYEDDLLNRREDFKKCGDVKLLRKLNPYYDDEEIAYKEIKETRHLN